MNDEKPARPTQDILLDTCILQYSGRTPSASRFLKYLSILGERKFGLAISEFTIYELLQGTSKTKEQELVKILKKFKQFKVTANVLMAAAQLSTLYRREKIPDSQISDGDKIIASTAILTGSLIVTANWNDFPRPFFIESEIKRIEYKKKGKPVMIPVYLLSPDMIVIKDRFKNRPKT